METHGMETQMTGPHWIVWKVTFTMSASRMKVLWTEFSWHLPVRGETWAGPWKISYVLVDLDSATFRKMVMQIDDLIQRIPSINVVSVDSRNIDLVYKNMIENGSFESLISVIKTAFLINKERIDNNKKIRDKDNYYFSLAEQYLYNEFSVVLGLSFDETKQYVINEVEKLIWSIWIKV